DLVERSVAAEGDHDVVATLAGLAADLNRVVLGLGRHGLDVVAALECVDDEVLEPVGNRRRVRIDDDQHPLLARARRRRSTVARGLRSPRGLDRRGCWASHPWGSYSTPRKRIRPPSVSSRTRPSSASRSTWPSTS